MLARTIICTAVAGDAKAIAALWTENVEIHEADGSFIRGRATSSWTTVNS